MPNAFSLSVKSQEAADKGDVDTFCTLDYVTIPGKLDRSSQAKLLSKNNAEKCLEKLFYSCLEQQWHSKVS